MLTLLCLYVNFKIQRRLAQNREAARKSRLRKKVGKQLPLSLLQALVLVLCWFKSTWDIHTGVYSAIGAGSFKIDANGARA